MTFDSETGLFTQPQPGAFPLHRHHGMAVPETIDGVHVWVIDVANPWQSVAALEALLSDAEKQRAMRYAMDTVRRQFIVSRGSLRLLLGQFHQSVELRETDRGKPYVADSPIHFNVAHSGGRVVIAMAKTRVGIDIEELRAMPNAAGLVKRFFSEREHNQFQSLPEDKQLTAFFRGWTAKEALLKAVGVGLVDLESCVVDLLEERIIHFSHPPMKGSEWRLRTISFDGHMLSTAIES